eukprot:270047-Chlamydomonas_euryale.AAC.5
MREALRTGAALNCAPGCCEVRTSAPLRTARRGRSELRPGVAVHGNERAVQRPPRNAPCNHSRPWQPRCASQTAHRAPVLPTSTTSRTPPPNDCLSRPQQRVAHPRPHALRLPRAQEWASEISVRTSADGASAELVFAREASLRSCLASLGSGVPGAFKLERKDATANSGAAGAAPPAAWGAVVARNLPGGEPPAAATAAAAAPVPGSTSSPSRAAADLKPSERWLVVKSAAVKGRNLATPVGIPSGASTSRSAAQAGSSAGASPSTAVGHSRGSPA